MHIYDTQKRISFFYCKKNKMTINFLYCFHYFFISHQGGGLTYQLDSAIQTALCLFAMIHSMSSALQFMWSHQMTIIITNYIRKKKRSVLMNT